MLESFVLEVQPVDAVVHAVLVLELGEIDIAERGDRARDTAGVVLAKKALFA